MTSFILGRKRGMTQFFAENGDIVPVTVVAAGPCTVTFVRTPERDGYRAYQLGFELAKEKHLRKPQREFFKKAKLEPMRIMREQRLAEGEEAPEVGSQVTVEAFEPGMFVDVIGQSKGKGFQGTVKRHGFGLGPKSHGSMNYRRPGSIGCSAYPSKVHKGKRMSGHMGARRYTQKNLLLVGHDPQRNLLFVRGAIPGANGGLVIVRSAKTYLEKVNQKIPSLAHDFAAAGGATSEGGES